MGDFGVILYYFWVDQGHLGIILASFWCHFDPIVRPFWCVFDLCRRLCGPFSAKTGHFGGLGPKMY